jgi:glutamine amidotransferase
MQWNQLVQVGTGPASLRGLGLLPWVYFVHSFAPPVGDETVAVCDYGGPVAALVERGNLWGAQFHPEKSGRTGLALLANFVARAV